MLEVMWYAPGVPSTPSVSRYTSFVQPMFFGNRPLVITLWLITVSAAMSPTSAFGKLVPLRWSSWTFFIP